MDEPGRSLMNRLDLDTVLSWVPEGSRVLDLGCGDGALTEKILDAGATVIGIDADQAMVERLKEKYRTEAGSELVFRFEFPERPGALVKFLNKIGSRWNISAFHYRNHGAAYGRVLVSMQAKLSERDELLSYFDDIGYKYFDETENPAVSLFMKG